MRCRFDERRVVNRIGIFDRSAVDDETAARRCIRKIDIGVGLDRRLQELGNRDRVASVIDRAAQHVVDRFILENHAEVVVVENDIAVRIERAHRSFFDRLFERNNVAVEIGKSDRRDTARNEDRIRTVRAVNSRAVAGDEELIVERRAGDIPIGGDRN